jgi:nitroreductase
MGTAMSERRLDLLDAMRTTGAVRDFTDEAVGAEVVARIIDAARFAPSGGNRQPWRVILLEDAGLRRQIWGLHLEAMNAYFRQVQAGLVPFSVRLSEEDEKRASDAIASGTKVFDAPLPPAAMLVLCADLRGLAVTDKDLDRHSIVGGASVYPFAQNILLAAKAEGLGGLITTALCRQEPQARPLLAIPDDFAIAGLLLLGYPVRKITRLRRKPVGALLVTDSFEGPPVEASS